MFKEEKRLHKKFGSSMMRIQDIECPTENLRHNYIYQITVPRICGTSLEDPITYPINFYV